MGILVFSGTFLYFRLRHTLIKKADEFILDEKEELMPSIMDRNSTLSDLKRIIEREFSEDRYYKLSARLLDADGNTLIASDNFLTQNLIKSEIAVAKAGKSESVFKTIRVKERNHPFRLLTQTIHQDGSLKYFLQICLYLKPVYKTIENIEENFILLIPPLIIFSITGGWVISKRSLSLIKNISKTAQEITASNLNKRLVPSHTEDEVDELINTINLMLDRIEESFQKVVQFTSDVSHELRTPIAALKTGTEVTLSKERSAEEYRELLEDNLTSLERMSRLISDLLDLSRSDSNTNILDVKPFNLGTMLKEIHSKFMPISDSKKIRSSVKTIPGVIIKGDEILLRRVFYNLLDNAVKYTSPGGSISLSLEDRGNDVIACVSDTGIGISQENLRKIFERFFRVDASRSREEADGAGLGLSISKNIVELHKGKIEVKSDPGAGSTFEVILPKNFTNS
ncbi:MAG: heavy metal sensor histidine kinase [Candidatus Scalindua sp.]|nr:heavy metal sensor histidine kinase [Candidatus Scalindua sp.]